MADREHALTLSAPARLRRTSMEVRMVLNGADPYDTGAKPDPSLIRLILKAHRLHEKLINGDGRTLEAIDAEEGIGAFYFTRDSRVLPIEWSGQRDTFGFG